MDKTCDSKCDLCKIEKETQLHLMCKCSKVIPIWKAYKRWVKHFLDFEIRLDNSTIVLNNYKGPHSLLINQIILIIKQYIYMSKCKKQKLNFVEIMKRTHEMYLDEKFICQSNNNKNVKSFNKKWKGYERTM